MLNLLLKDNGNAEADRKWVIPLSSELAVNLCALLYSGYDLTQYTDALAKQRYGTEVTAKQEAFLASVLTSVQSNWNKSL